jgi:fructokinase
MVDIVILGEALIDMLATEKNVTLFDAPAFEPKPGGAPANVAVGVQRLGGSSALVGRVGNDEFGHGLRQLLETEGVDTSSLITDSELMTTMALVSLTDIGDPHFAFYLGASQNLHPDDLNVDLIANAKFFHFSSVTLASEPSRSAIMEGLRLAKEHGVICSYDVNWRPAIWPDLDAGKEIIKEPIPQIDLLKLSAEELKLITGMEDTRAGLETLDVPAPLVVVTLGKDGCLYRFEDKIYHQSVAPVNNVVDATGAGDAFMAALLTGLSFPIKVKALERLTKRACKAGAITVSQRGAIPSLPHSNELIDHPI